MHHISKSIYLRQIKVTDSVQRLKILQKNIFTCLSVTSMGGSTKSQKAGTLKQLEAKIVKKPASYRDYVGT